MKSTLIIFFVMIGIHAITQSESNIYKFKVKTIAGDEISMEKFKGKKILIVNTASKCGYTTQYADLQKLYEKYGGDDFIIVGFPANNFFKQEPGSNQEIKEFCTINYGVTFPMMEKISVKGKDQHPLYAWLTKKNLNGAMESKVKWNFQKYMIDEEGNLIDYASPGEKPLSKKILDWIQAN